MASYTTGAFTAPLMPRVTSMFLEDEHGERVPVTVVSIDQCQVSSNGDSEVSIKIRGRLSTTAFVGDDKVHYILDQPSGPPILMKAPSYVDADGNPRGWIRGIQGDPINVGGLPPIVVMTCPHCGHHDKGHDCDDWPEDSPETAIAPAVDANLAVNISVNWSPPVNWTHRSIS